MELLIRIVDTSQTDAGLAPTASKRGEVLTIQPDGWPWSVRELTNPHWRIVRAPILQTHAETLMARAASALEAQTKPYWSRRKYKFSLDSLPAQIGARFTDSVTDPRAEAIIEVTRASLTGITTEKTS